MTYVASRPVLITEGHGDVSSVPCLVRRIGEAKQQFELVPLVPPIRCGGLSKLKRPDELNRFVALAALRENRDSILIAIDCDDGCAKEEVLEFITRLKPMAERFQVKIAVSFFVREFESLFLHCLPELAAKFPDLEIIPHPNLDVTKIEDIRNAKGYLGRQMRRGSYKPTRDQASFVYALDLQKLTHQSRCFRHLSSCIDFLRDAGSGLVYPVI